MSTHCAIENMVKYPMKPCKGDILEEKRNKKDLSTVGAEVLIFCAAPMGLKNILRWFITKLSPLRGCSWPTH
jgi:hypothetical protein